MNKVQILLGDLKRETKKYNEILNAQTKKLQQIKDQIDFELKKQSLKTND